MPHKTLKVGISKTQFDRGEVIARKTLQFMGFDPALFDRLSKKQKLTLLNIENPLPVVRVKKGHHVPRHYINNVRTEIMNFMRTHYVDADAKLTYMELATYGLAFLFATEIRRNQVFFTREQEDAFVTRLMERFAETNLINEGGFQEVFNELHYQMSLYSQVNFRTYGSGYTWEVQTSKEIVGLGLVRLVFELTAQENERIYFTYKGKTRLAFRLLLGQTTKYMASAACICKEKLYPGIKSDKRYNIYIQSHVIHRFKERMDILETTNRNHLIYTSMTEYQEVVQDAYGHPLLVCSVQDQPLGYFPFTIQEDNLFVLSFLPFVSHSTPPGEKLYNILHLCKEDIVYLGMDKLSFYVLVDFDQIPVLKDALIASGIWSIKEMVDKGCIENDGFDLKKTAFVKDFFEKMDSLQSPKSPEEGLWETAETI